MLFDQAAEIKRCRSDLSNESKRRVVLQLGRHVASSPAFLLVVPKCFACPSGLGLVCARFLPREIYFLTLPRTHRLSFRTTVIQSIAWPLDDAAFLFCLLKLRRGVSLPLSDCRCLVVLCDACLLECSDHGHLWFCHEDPLLAFCRSVPESNRRTCLGVLSNSS